MMSWGNMMNGWGHHPGNFFMGSGWFGMLGMLLNFVFWIVIVVIVYKMFRTKSLSRDYKSSNNKALEILRERYAKGEINTEEFNQRKTALDFKE